MNVAKPFPPYLVQAYQTWKQKSFPAQKKAFKTLARDGQAPDFMVISCCDSRVLPTDIFGACAGDMFVHRNIANLVPAYAAPSGDSAVDAHGTSAALEYAVRVLKVAHVLVLGHAQCGGVKGCHDMCKAGKRGSEFDLPLVGAWLEVMRPVYEQMAANHEAIDMDEMGRQSIVHSLNNLLTFPFIAEAVAAGKLEVHGAWHDVGTGTMMAYSSDTDNFIKV